MAKNFWRPIQLKELVLASGMTRRGFLKAFLKHTGITPGFVLRHARIEYAKQLLTEHDLPLRAIAERCGYRSQNTFIVAFTRATGMAPKKFQRHVWLTICRTYQHAEAASKRRAAQMAIGFWIEAGNFPPGQGPQTP